jgi:hypothetical protein
VLWNRWQQKPPQGTAVNQFLGLTQGLVGLYALNEWSGGTIVDGIGNLNLATMGFGSTNPWASGTAVGISLTVNGASANAPLPVDVQIQPPITLAVGYRQIGVANGNAPLCGIFYNNSNGAQFAFEVASGASTIGLCIGVGGYAPSLTSASLALKDHVASASFFPSVPGQSLYIDGALSGSSGAGPAFASYSATSLVDIGSAGSTYSGRYCNALVYWVGVWNRALSDAEHALIGSSVNAIWQIMQPPQFNWLAQAAILGGGAYYPGSSIFRPAARTRIDGALANHMYN